MNGSDNTVAAVQEAFVSALRDASGHDPEIQRGAEDDNRETQRSLRIPIQTAFESLYKPMDEPNWQQFRGPVAPDEPEDPRTQAPPQTGRAAEGINILVANERQTLVRICFTTIVSNGNHEEELQRVAALTADIRSLAAGGTSLEFTVKPVIIRETHRGLEIECKANGILHMQQR